MNLRWMNTKCYMPIKLVFLVALAGFIYGCSGSSGDEVAKSSGTVAATDRDEGDGERRCRDDDCDEHHGHDDDEHHGDDDDEHRGDGGGQGGTNIIASHNPQSPQFNDNCLECHGDITDAQSLDANIPDAHVAMLAFTPGEEGKQCAWCHRDVSENLMLTASAVGPFQSNIRKLVDTQLCSICHGPVGPGRQFYQTGLTAGSDLDGARLYHFLCSSCHRELTNSEVDGESTQEIYEAIAENEGGMGPLSVLNPQWIQAITVALGGDTTLPPDMPAAGTGAALYQQYCSGCHGALASSDKAGATASQIQTAITDDLGGMSQFSFLTAQQIQAIADALSGQTTPPPDGGGGGGTDGAALYQQYCSGCHGDLANSDQAGAAASLIQTAITNDTGGMNQFSFLTAQQIQAIADALSGQATPPPDGGGGGGTDGAALYQQYCSGCHGDLANSDQAGAAANQIQDAITNDTGGMSSLGSLSSEQINAIAAALNQ